MYSVIRIKGNRSRWKGIALKPFFIAQMFTFSYEVHGFFIGESVGPEYDSLLILRLEGER